MQQQQNTSPTPPQKPAYLVGNEPIHVCTEEGAALAHQLIDDAIAEPTYDDIFHAMRALETTLAKGCPDLDKKNPALAAKHKQKIMEAKWMVLERLLPEEIEELFKSSLEHLFEHDNEGVVPALRRILHAVVPDWDARDAQKKKWLDAMVQSTATIGNQSIDVNGVKAEPTVQNWLKLWKEHVGDYKQDSLQVVEFINSTTSVNALLDEDRKKLEQLLKLQIELSKSSLTPEGNEDKAMFVDPVTGTIKSYAYGQISDTGVPAPQEDVKDMRAVYNVDEHGRQRSTAQLLKNSIVMRYARPELFEGAKKSKEELVEVEEDVQPSPSVKQPKVPKQTPVEKPTPPPSTPTKSTQRTPEKSTGVDYVIISQRVLAAHKLLLPSLEQERRFLSIVTSYLKGVRGSIEAREALTATPEQGGVSITASQAEAVLATADEELNMWKLNPEQRRHVRATTTAPTPTLAMVRQRIEEQKRLQKQRPQQPTTTQEPVDMFGPSNVAVTPVPLSPTPSAVLPQQVTRPQAAPRHKFTPERGKQPVVMGPIDELKQLTAEEFRTLGIDARTASRTIIEKIHLLEQESIERKAEAINAWKSSPLHQLYLDIGNQSLESTLPVEAVIKQREKSKQPTLTVEEFDAVADINRQLRF